MQIKKIKIKIKKTKVFSAMQRNRANYAELSNTANQASQHFHSKEEIYFPRDNNYDSSYSLSSSSSPAMQAKRVSTADHDPSKLQKFVFTLLATTVQNFIVSIQLLCSLLCISGFSNQLSIVYPWNYNPFNRNSYLTASINSAISLITIYFKL